ncbi:MULTISPECIES: hypothetical protein [unclassified Breznakia]|uniref:hypothetical protein n=1 Tax=unclassified Breznakia TaxID=2623764 RepID=UPI002473E191|nr:MULTISPECIES: hypothetical protein [unclassified Breznakia]MDH6366915.1 hypothetical protein [Breznakia sp. PH1-1]MDH6404093.1 hypothetical protein [Breznakia sp. PF1-11]MDH6411802.1 hypothetical protein [Breznakia sp. PFB1-11]MDH6414081.1 hypothetical protein [Breznakia sp. PFB1-14]MDH6416562.1 hypothetical protein [Breznakia sp. PFB1-4]
MKLDEKKKAKEKAILNHVYSDANYEIIPSERPDFTLKAKNKDEVFGVEITELYLSENHAKAMNLKSQNAEMISPSYERYKQKLLEVIADKNQKSMQYSKDVAYLELVIDDCEKQFINADKDFFTLLKENEEMHQVIAASNFKRVFVLSKYKNAPIVIALEA